jgi:hypothetical protein
MKEVSTNPIPESKVSLDYSFVVNEFPRIRVPRKSEPAPTDFREMPKMQRQMIVRRLIEHLHEI